MYTRKILSGLLAGLAIGTTLGMLYAPHKGSVSRRKLARKGNKYAGELEDKFNQFVENVTEQFESIKQEAKSAAAGMQSKLKETGS